MKTKQEVLESNGYELLEGYMLDYDKDRDYDQVFIAREDVVKFFSEKPQQYYWNDMLEYLVDEEDAWERLYEDWCDKNLKENQDIEFKDWELRMLEGE